MTAHPEQAAFRTDGLIAAHARRDLLRFITCGSVDDGKSTLIGRLLWESKQLFEDQLDALARDSTKFGTQGEALDLALLVDGLSAEREQGITIDVAYRFFSTERRSFIVADTPGHEQYTRNMATGASTADLAILLVDARKGLVRQTRRHSLLVSMLGIRHVVVAVNKMDLVNWSQSSFDGIVEDYRAFAAGLGFEEIVGIPISARDGDNVAAPSDNAPWYRGPDLLSHLESVDAAGSRADLPFRLPVQWVNRPDPGFRGFSGLVASGRIRPGERVRILPSGEETGVERIVTYDGDLTEAASGQSVTLTLADHVDVSRGSVIAAADRLGRLTSRIDARLFWMTRDALREGQSFFVKLGTQSAVGTVARVRSRVNLETLANGHAERLEVNDVGDVSLDLDRPLAWDAYAANRETGSFILIDRESFDTVGMGLAVEEADRAFEAIATSEPDPPAADTMGRPALPPNGSKRIDVGALGWNILGTLGTMAVALGFVGDITVAAGIAVVDRVVRSVLSFARKRA